MLAGIIAGASPVGAPIDNTEFALIARTTTVSGGVLALMGLDLTDYQAIFVTLDGLRGENIGVGLQLSIDGVVQTAGYRHVKQSYDSANIGGALASQSADRIALSSYVSGGNSSSSWNFIIGNPDSGLWKLVKIGDARNTDGTTAHRGFSAGLLERTGTMDGIVILPGSGGVITSGALAVYGVRKGDRSPAAAELVSLWVGALT